MRNDRIDAGFGDVQTRASSIGAGGDMSPSDGSGVGPAGWSPDNRPAGFRICGTGTPALRVECRIGGADLNPYLAMAALLAAGIDGIEQEMTLEPAFVGDAYQGAKLREVPKTLREATELMDKSDMLRAALGDEVVEHYVHTARWEQFEYDRRVTDWELKRGFERY